MNNFRVFLSTSFFIMSSYFVFDLIFYGFDWLLLIASILGYVLAHYIWPPKFDDESHWYDLLEYVVDLPFRILVSSIRGIGSIFKNSDSSFDL